MIFIKKNHELYVNLKILADFIAITKTENYRKEIQKMEKTRLDELYIWMDGNFRLKWILYFDSYNWKTEKIV